MSLLFYESPIIGGISLIAICGCTIYKAPKIVTLLSFIVFFSLILFYRYSGCNDIVIDDETIISPCEGTIVTFDELPDSYYISIFLSVFDKHFQVYPVNGIVIHREYDNTGKFNIVRNLDKSKYNEKKIHFIKMNNDSIISLTQIAGYIPRAITSDENLCKYNAGEYLGMIKFGSRIDLVLPKKSPDGKILNTKISLGDKLTIGDYIGHYEKLS